MNKESKPLASEDAVAAYVEDKDTESASQEDRGSPTKTDEATARNANDADRELLRKIDLNLLPWLCLLYLASFLDRTNIGNAKIAGLQHDLNMSDGQWQASLAIFFVPYSVFEPASNVLLKKVKPSIYLPIM